MDHLQNVLSYFDQQQPLCAEHDRIPKDLYREFGVKAGLRDETGKGVLAGLTNISDIRAFQYVDGVKHPADGQLLYRGYDVKDSSTAAAAAALPLRRRDICCCLVSCPPRSSWSSSVRCWASAAPCPPTLPAMSL